MTVTHLFGIRYTWVDVLTIIQDYPDNWLVESEGMAAVYGNAYIMFAAMNTTDYQQGFLTRTPTTRHYIRVWPSTF
jgi:Heterokaryon incompatibility protein (HET).